MKAVVAASTEREDESQLGSLALARAWGSVPLVLVSPDRVAPNASAGCSCEVCHALGRFRCEQFEIPSVEKGISLVGLVGFAASDYRTDISSVVGHSRERFDTVRKRSRLDQLPRALAG